MVSALEIAEALGQFPPTPQQIAVIEADLTPALVVAGAGSGKTETMANRVLWLLANGHVAAADVLGLTFTRKAAGELASRIRERITQLAERGLVVGGYDPFEPPTVATYNSFANTIYRDHAILLGRESDGAVLGEASAWQLARDIVVASTDERLAPLGRSVDDVTKYVLALSHELSENVADPAEVAAYAARFSSVADLPLGGRAAYASVDEWVSRVSALPLLLDLAARFDEAKQRRGLVEYSDQVALALRILEIAPDVVLEYRDRYRVVLLDEYQDTAVVQTRLLAELFAQHPVMAVGDPNQSIYGWRGASAANLDGFSAQFARGTAQQFALSTSWRNGHGILAVANALVEPFTATSRVPVERLVASPTASDLPVELTWSQTLPDEAAAVADWLARRLSVPSGETPPSAAILFRARRSQGVFIDALRDRGVPFHVLGVGGLMSEPEIADLVSALTVVDDPSAGVELVRLLTGSRWRIGVRDLRALREVSSWLQRRDHRHQPLDDDVRQALRDSVAEGEGGSIVDALDFVGSARDGHVILEGFSPVGLERLRDAAGLFASLRARAGLDLLDFVTFVEQEMLLDIEVIANEGRALGSATMDAFFDALTSYLAVGEASTLAGFLSWLRQAEWRDSLAPRPEEPEPGTVQLMTVHGSKGLERDLVVVPRFVESELPGTPRDGSGGWLSWGTLPWPFRGDAAELPVFAWEGVETRKELVERQKEFAEAVKARHDDEERRLAYVAVTRARHSLLLTGSFWSTQQKPRGPSSFLVPLAEAGVVGELPTTPDDAENPLGEAEAQLIWPRDPLGGRRAAVEWAAAEVRSARPGGAGRWTRDLDVLLEERRRRLGGGDRVPLPTRVPASRFKDFVTDPARVAADLRRPMPERPYRATRLGTLFHSWVEERFGSAAGVGGGVDAIDAFDLELDESEPMVEQAELKALQQTFSRSQWADRAPIEVEREVHLPFDGRIVICKIDAVYRDGERYQVVDWKTGKAPTSSSDLEEKQLQLALYRLAYATWAGIDPSLIDAVFYYVADDRVIEPERVFDEPELLSLWRAATT